MCVHACVHACVRAVRVHIFPFVKGCGAEAILNVYQFRLQTQLVLTRSPAKQALAVRRREP